MSRIDTWRRHPQTRAAFNACTMRSSVEALPVGFTEDMTEDRFSLLNTSATRHPSPMETWANTAVHYLL
jgi:hypothetical protein